MRYACKSSAAAILAGIALGALSSAALAGDDGQGKASSTQQARAEIYDTKADAKEQIAAALANARRENQRVLLMFGGNWCGWCHKLHDLFTTNKDIAKTLQYEYQLLLVDVGRFDKHVDIAKGYGVDLKKAGVPFLTILDSDGKVLANQETGSLEVDKRHDPEKVAALLERFKATPRDAQKELDAALQRAAAGPKRVFVYLGAPWCVWCHRLSDFLAEKEIAAIMERNFVTLKIDVERMTHGKEVARKLRGSEKGGIPWFAVLDSDGHKLATSDGPDGNIGFPVRPQEIEHFMAVLKQTAPNASAEELAKVATALKENAAKIEAARSSGG